MKTGIWIDSDKAFIVDLKEGSETTKRIDSNVEHFNLHGGARSSTPYGPQDVASESKLLERKKHQLNDYFNKIISELEATSAIAIFGPAETKMGLMKKLKGHPRHREKVVGYQTADSMTDNQMRALIRAFFNNHNSK